MTGNHEGRCVGDGQSSRIGLPLSQSVSIVAAEGRFATNVGSNVIFLVLSVVFGLWFIPYLVKHLGVAAYGFVPLAASVTDYMSILTTGLNNATARFLTIDLAKGDQMLANRTFNSALAGALLLAGLLLPIAVGISWVAPRVFDVPAKQEVDVGLLFAFVGLAFLLNLIGSSFAVSSFSCSRFDLRNWIALAQLAVRAGLVVAMFVLLSPHLWQVGLSTAAAALVAFLGGVVVWRKLTPELIVDLGQFDRRRLRDLMGMGGWVVVNRVGSLLFLSVDLIVLNMVFGAETAGRYGSVLIFSTLLRRLAMAVAGVLDPIIMAQYAEKDLAGMTRLSRQAVRLMGLGLALPIGLLCGLARPLLGVWLGPSFQDLDVLLVVLVGHLCINLAVLPLFPLQPALNRVRVPGIVTLLMGCLNVGLAIAWAKWGAWGAVGVAAAGAVVLTLKNTVFTPLYGAGILHQRWGVFLSSLLGGVVATLILGLASFGSTYLYMPDSWPGLMAVGGVVSLAYGGFLMAWGLNGTDRQFLARLVPWRVR